MIDSILHWHGFHAAAAETTIQVGSIHDALAGEDNVQCTVDDRDDENGGGGNNLVGSQARVSFGFYHRPQG